MDENLAEYLVEVGGLVDAPQTVWAVVDLLRDEGWETTEGIGFGTGPGSIPLSGYDSSQNSRQLADMAVEDVIGHARRGSLLWRDLLRSAFFDAFAASSYDDLRCDLIRLAATALKCAEAAEKLIDGGEDAA